MSRVIEALKSSHPNEWEDMFEDLLDEANDILESSEDPFELFGELTDLLCSYGLEADYLDDFIGRLSTPIVE